MNIRLKVAIARSGETSKAIARLAGIHPTTLSSIVHDDRIATPGQRSNIAEALGCAEADIFEPEPVQA